MRRTTDKDDGFTNCNWGDNRGFGGNGTAQRQQSSRPTNDDEFTNCNWGDNHGFGGNGTAQQQQPSRPTNDEFTNCTWGDNRGFNGNGSGTAQRHVPPNNINQRTHRMPLPPQEVPLPSPSQLPMCCLAIEPPPVRPSNIVYVDGIEDYQNELPLMRVEEIASVFFLHITKASVLDVKRILPTVTANHYAVVELGTVDQAKQAVSILNGITINTGHRLAVSFSRVPVSFVPSNFALLQRRAEKRRNDPRNVVEEHPVEGERFC